ncbi:hypothetical protein SK128_005106 [Halocaridina rubra]|uniref:Sulfhydryl oxidase n=1 Tax=Halocaridina rubra TaxID=373956 RepID=A0AAN8ZZF9_HALRR
MAADINKHEDADLKNAFTQEKPCRTCTDFRSWMTAQRGIKKTPGTVKVNTDNGNSNNKKNSNNDEHKTQNETVSQASSVENSKFSDEDSNKDCSGDDPEYPLWGKAAKYGCPADSIALGRGTWRLLHSMAAYYPDKPTVEVQNDMFAFIKIFSKFYPCPPCAEDFRNWLKSHTPDVSSRSGLSRWFCDAHNEVNVKLGKPEFDCNLIDQRWKDGWADGSCD